MFFTNVRRSGSGFSWASPRCRCGPSRRTAFEIQLVSVAVLRLRHGRSCGWLTSRPRQIERQLPVVQWGIHFYAESRCFPLKWTSLFNVWHVRIRVSVLARTVDGFFKCFRDRVFIVVLVRIIIMDEQINSISKTFGRINERFYSMSKIFNRRNERIYSLIIFSNDWKLSKPHSSFIRIVEQFLRVGLCALRLEVFSIFE